MSEFRLNIPYMTLKNSNVRVFYVFWAVLGALIAYGLSFGIETLFPNNAANWIWITLVALLGGALYVYLPYQIHVMNREGNRIFVDKDGIVFMPFTCRGLGFRWTRRWSDLYHITVNCENPAKLTRRDHLLLSFKSGGSARLNLDKMKGEDIEQFLMAVELLAPECTRSAELTTYQEYLQDENKGREGFSYTKLWEDELARRFQTTSFVPLAPGDRLEAMSLTIVQQLAFGGFSAIYLAENQSGEKLVVKESVPCRGATAETRAKAEELFDREAEILSKIEHSAIAKVRGSFSERSHKYMVLEYIQGPNLRQHVRSKGPQPLESVLAWAIEMCDMLDYLHAQAPPVMHRDFTPDNLVLSNDGKLTLVDFGAANEFIGTVTGTLIGKQCYMPPEQVRGKPHPESDLYALGATIHFLIAGSDPVALVPCRPRKHAETVPEELDDLVCSLTSLELKERPPSARAVKERLQEIAERMSGTTLKVNEKREESESGSIDLKVAEKSNA